MPKPSELADALQWDFHAACCWCNSPFTKIEIDGMRVWICPTQSCRDRQLHWRLDDSAGKLMYLPSPKQVELEEAIATQQFDSICAGGHRSGGKSRALRMIAYRYCRTFENFTVLFLRREWEQLRLNHMRFAEREAVRMDTKLSNKRIMFPETGAELTFHHMQDPDDFRSFIGAEFDMVIFDQLELFTREQFVETGAAASRIQRDRWRGLVLAGENPGGPLSAFVSELFIKRNLDREKYPDYNPDVHHFVEFKIDDNPYTDERYEQRLALLTPERRAMFRHGRRDVFPRQYFPEFHAEHHVVPFRPIVGANYFRAMFWGYHRPGCVVWIAVESSRHLTVAAVLPIEKLNEDAVAARVHKIDRELNVHPSFTVANPEIFGGDPNDAGFSGQTIAETLALYECPVICGDADLVSGWKRCHSVLRDAPDLTPWLRIHESCTPLIEALQNAMSDKRDLDLVDDESPNLAALQALRLGMMARPAPEFAPTTTVYPPDTAGWYLERAKREHRQQAGAR